MMRIEYLNVADLLLVMLIILEASMNIPPWEILSYLFQELANSFIRDDIMEPSQDNRQYMYC